MNLLRLQLCKITHIIEKNAAKLGIIKPEIAVKYVQ